MAVRFMTDIDMNYVAALVSGHTVLNTIEDLINVVFLELGFEIADGPSVDELLKGVLPGNVREVIDEHRPRHGSDGISTTGTNIGGEPPPRGGHHIVPAQRRVRLGRSHRSRGTAGQQDRGGCRRKSDKSTHDHPIMSPEMPLCALRPPTSAAHKHIHENERIISSSRSPSVAAAALTTEARELLDPGIQWNAKNWNRKAAGTRQLDHGKTPEPRESTVMISRQRQTVKYCRRTPRQRSPGHSPLTGHRKPRKRIGTLEHPNILRGPRRHNLTVHSGVHGHRAASGTPRMVHSYGTRQPLSQASGYESTERANRGGAPTRAQGRAARLRARRRGGGRS